MVAVYPERQSRAALWARRLAIFAVVLFVVAGAAHRFGRLHTETFLQTIGVVGGLFVLASLAFAYAFHRMWSYGDRVGTNLFVAGVALAVGLTPFGNMAWRGLTTPQLNDVSTDTEARPVLAAVPDRTPAMNVPRAMTAQEAEEQLAAYPKVIGHSYTLPAERMRQLISGLVSARGWRVVRSFGAGDTLNVVAGSFLLGFPSDVAIRVTDEETASYVDMRSASRYGTHDFGDNAIRIQRFFDDLDAAVLEDASTSAAGQ